MAGQERYNLDQLVAIALEKNHQLRVTRNIWETVENQANPGVAGLLPAINASGSYNYSRNNAELEFANPNQAPIIAEGAVSKVLSGNIGVSYVLNDGFGNVYRFQQLKKNSVAAEVETQIAIESTVIQVLSTAMDFALTKELADISRQNLEVSRERWLRATRRLEIGNGSRVDVLSAEVDLNADSISYTSNQVEVQVARRNLALLVGLGPEQAFDVDVQVILDVYPEVQTIIEEAQTENSTLVLSQLRQEQSKLDLSIARSAFMPTLSLDGGYSYNRTENEAGFVISQTTDGLNLGVSLQVGLFQGLRRKITVENTRIALENAELNRELTLLTVERDVRNTFDRYQNTRYQFEKEQNVLDLAQTNLDRSLELFELGQVTGTQLREAQINVLRAKSRLQTSLYAAKLLELQLMQFRGQLLDSFTGQ